MAPGPTAGDCAGSLKERLGRLVRTRRGAGYCLLLSSARSPERKLKQRAMWVTCDADENAEGKSIVLYSYSVLESSHELNGPDAEPGCSAIQAHPHQTCAGSQDTYSH